MLEKILGWIGPLIFYFVFHYVWSRYQKKCEGKKAVYDKISGYKVVTQGIMVKIVAWIMVFIILLLFVVLPIVGVVPDDFIEWGIFVSGLILCVVVTIFLFIQAFGSVVHYNSNEIVKKTMFFKDKVIKFSEIKDYRHSSLKGCYVITSINGDKINLDEGMVGLEELLRKISKYE